MKTSSRKTVICFDANTRFNNADIPFLPKNGLNGQKMLFSLGDFCSFFHFP